MIDIWQNITHSAEYRHTQKITGIWQNERYQEWSQLIAEQHSPSRMTRTDLNDRHPKK